MIFGSLTLTADGEEGNYNSTTIEDSPTSSVEDIGCLLGSSLPRTQAGLDQDILFSYLMLLVLIASPQRSHTKV